MWKLLEQIIKASTDDSINILSIVYLEDYFLFLRGIKGTEGVQK